MECRCEGEVRSEYRDFGLEADVIAEKYQIPPPRFGVTIHDGAECLMPDVPHDIPEDYSHPEDRFGIQHKEPSLVQDGTTS